MSVLVLNAILVSHCVFAFDKYPKELELSGYNYITPLHIYLNDDQKLWLQNKKIIKVAVYQPAQPPLVQTIVTGRYRGMNADYLALIQHSLNTRVSVLSYQDKISALSALRSGEVDMVLTALDDRISNESGVIASQPLVYSWPNLVCSLSNVMAPLHSAKSTRIAIVDRYPDEDFIHQSFPHSEIINYSNYQEALSSVANGHSDWFIGDSLTTSTWLSQEFSLELTTVKYWSSPQKKSEFLFLPAEKQLMDIINNTIDAIDENVHGQIAQSTIDKGNLSFLIQPLDLTYREKKWLETHKTLRVIINPWFAPYTMLDSNNETRGIVGDILNLISLQTGLKFETIVVKSNEEMISEMKKGAWDLVQAATYNLEREKYISFTHPYITTQFVAVVQKENENKAALSSGTSVAVSTNHSLLAKLKARYKGVHWVEVDNSSVGLNLVATGKVDVAISNQLTARYMGEHYYPEQLSWFPIPGEEPAAISFAVPRSEPELRQILDKALNDIPQKEILQIVSKWIRLPDVKIDTWELYNKPFYLVAIMSGLLVLSSFMWAIYLSREVRRRKRSQSLLEKEKNKAQKANEEKRQFLSHMSHEIRTPVSAIMGFLELLQLSHSDDQELIDQAAHASRSLLKLVGEILDLEKIESGLVELVPDWVTANQFMSEKISIFSALANQKGLKMEYQSELSSNVLIRIDPQLLGQVLINIIGNAVKYTEKGYVKIIVKKRECNLNIIVCDSGPGISSEEQTGLFEAFYQGMAGAQQRGSGLGLSISRALMKRMAGSITLTSRVGAGTEVSLHLPIESKSDMSKTPDSKEYKNHSPDFSAIMLNVLIADDHPTSRLLLARQLDMLGITYDEVSNGETALSYLKQANYDLLITDINMPLMDGVVLARAARKLNPGLVIWGLTATAQSNERERCLAAGMNLCLFKPVTITQISQLLLEVSSAWGDQKFDVERLGIFANGNRELMIRALKDAQFENRNDLAVALIYAQSSDYCKAKDHIHRIHGTAQLLGARDLMKASQLLEDKLSGNFEYLNPVEEFETISQLLNVLDDSIAKFCIVEPEANHLSSHGI